MKQLGSDMGHAAWNDALIKQLGFIKKHLRYPIGRHTLWPALLLPAIGFMICTAVFTKTTSSYKPSWLPLLPISIILITGIATARRYLQTLRFIAIPARRSVAENMALLQQFLQAYHFAIGRHPQTPEVFQMMSKSIGTLHDEREVIIFIADNGRILINSHFTQSRFRMGIGSTHGRQVAQMLADWIETVPQPPSGERGLRTF